MKPMTMIALSAAFTSMPLQAAVPQPAPSASAADDAQVRSFLSALKAGRGSEAVSALMASSPLWAKHPGFSEQMTGQIDAAIKAYGPVTAYEKVSSTPLGTMAVREYVFVQHRDMVTRWEFDLVRTGSGWNIGYFGFTDQPNSWF